MRGSEYLKSSNVPCGSARSALLTLEVMFLIWTHVLWYIIVGTIPVLALAYMVGFNCFRVLRCALYTVVHPSYDLLRVVRMHRHSFKNRHAIDGVALHMSRYPTVLANSASASLHPRYAMLSKLRLLHGQLCISAFVPSLVPVVD
jgi:hypothetical protein